MSKEETTPSFILELKLKVSTKDEHILNKRIELSIILYNIALKYINKRLKAVRADKEYRELLNKKKKLKSKESKEDKEKRILINQRLKEIEVSYGYSENQVQKFTTKGYKHYDGIKIGSAVVQKIASRAFKAVEKVKFGKAKHANFKSKYIEEFSVENKQNGKNMTYRDGKVTWAGLELECKINSKNNYILEGLKSRTKYSRIIRKKIRGRNRFYVQLIQEGYPPKKDNRTIGNNTSVGLDIGPSTIAIVSNEYVGLHNLSNHKLENHKKEIRRLQRAMDRSRRSTNPNNYNEDGTIKKGKKTWIYSNNYKRLRHKLKKIHRKLRINRSIEHEKLANFIVSLGTDIRVETLNIQSWQKKAKKTTKNKKNGKINKKKRFGKSILNNAPSLLLEKINRKLTYEKEKLKKIDTKACKASQYNHIDNTYKKKKLNERITIVGEHKIQRDIYSAFLIKNTTNKLDKINRSKCNKDWKKFLENYQSI